jgi:thiamine kinase-like enzyme
MMEGSEPGTGALFTALGISREGLEQALASTPWHNQPLNPLQDTGLAHAHIGLGSSGQLLRIPKQSQVGLDPGSHLTHEAACFDAARPSRVTPVLHRVLPVSASLPRGGLILDFVPGQSLQLPGDLNPMMRSLGAIHGVRVPHPLHRQLRLPEDPMTSMLQEVKAQAEFLARAGIPEDVQSRLQSELQKATQGAAVGDRPAEALITFDAHPGNFLVDKQETAWMVDLEKCRISYPGFDLAHGTLYTSTTWDLNSQAVLELDDIVRAYRTWEQAFGPGGVEHRKWHVPLRRLMWLWSTTWCAKWLALSGGPGAGGGGQNWSESNNEQALNDHVRDRARHYLEARVVDAIVSEFRELEQILV